MALSRRTDAQTAKRAAVEGDILAATERLLGSGSAYADLSVDRIAREAGISRTAFYFYFRDKRELLMRLTQDVADRLYVQAEGWYRGEGNGPDLLNAALVSILALYRENAVLLRAVVEASTYDDQVAQFWRSVVGRFVDATRQRIADEQRAGRASDLDAETTAFSLVWMTERVAYQQLAQGIGNDEELTRTLTCIWERVVYGPVPADPSPG